MSDKKKERTVLYLDPDLREEYEELAKLDERELGEILRLALRLAKPLIKQRIRKPSVAGSIPAIGSIDYQGLTIIFVTP